MTNEFHNLEESLKKFLIDSQSDHYNVRNANFGKYNNLKIFIQNTKYSMAHFCIRIGISEAVFDIDAAEKISGGLGVDERLVRRWMAKSLNMYDLKVAWERQKRANASVTED